MISKPEEPGSSRPGKHPAAVDVRSYVVPCADVVPTAPFTWLRLGWQDLKAAPRVSLAYGFFVFALSAFVAWLAWRLGGYVLLISALSGFVFIAPLLAFGLYSVSRELSEGRRPSLRRSLRAVLKPFGNAAIFALILLVIFMVWARAGMMVHVFFPVDGQPKPGDIATFLAVGSAVGSLFAGFTFASAAFSLPMLANRDVDVVTAVVSSINAVLRNKWTMAVWAALIVVITALSLATAMLGLIVTIPWLAYATWHSYHEALDVHEWPTLE
ncbi:MAG: DUF2189 domain-containing protein [Xanthomonadales bacterium]|nr:DUF2189 domain-containing protein [Xanthomonadales bacterium]